MKLMLCARFPVFPRHQNVPLLKYVKGEVMNPQVLLCLAVCLACPFAVLAEGILDCGLLGLMYPVPLKIAETSVIKEGTTLFLQSHLQRHYDRAIACRPPKS